MSLVEINICISKENIQYNCEQSSTQKFDTANFRKVLVLQRYHRGSDPNYILCLWLFDGNLGRFSTNWCFP